MKIKHIYMLFFIVQNLCDSICSEVWKKNSQKHCSEFESGEEFFEPVEESGIHCQSLQLLKFILLLEDLQENLFPW